MACRRSEHVTGWLARRPTARLLRGAGEDLCHEVLSELMKQYRPPGALHPPRVPPVASGNVGRLLRGPRWSREGSAVVQLYRGIVGYSRTIRRTELWPLPAEAIPGAEQLCLDQVGKRYFLAVELRRR